MYLHTVQICTHSYSSIVCLCVCTCRKNAYITGSIYAVCMLLCILEVYTHAFRYTGSIYSPFVCFCVFNCVDTGKNAYIHLCILVKTSIRQRERGLLTAADST